MPRSPRKIVIAIVGLATGLVALTGCNGSFQGVGTMQSAANPRSSAFLLFKVLCNPTTQTVTGNLAYSDSAARVSIEATANSAASAYGPEKYTCDNDPNQGHYVGTFSGTMSGARAVGTMQLDLDVPGGCAGGAHVTLSLNAGSRSYYNSGCLVQGQVQPIKIGTATPSNSFPF